MLNNNKDHGFVQKNKGLFFVIGIVIIIILYSAYDEFLSPKATFTTSPPPKEGTFNGINIAVKDFTFKDDLGAQIKPQGVFAVVSLDIKNNSSKPITIDATEFKLLDKQKRKFSFSSDVQFRLLTTQKDQALAFTQLNPGMTAHGQIYYDVPRDASGFVLEGSSALFGNQAILSVQ